MLFGAENWQGWVVTDRHDTGKPVPVLWSSGDLHTNWSHLERQKDFALWEGISYAWRAGCELPRRSESMCCGVGLFVWATRRKEKKGRTILNSILYQFWTWSICSKKNEILCMQCLFPSSDVSSGSTSVDVSFSMLVWTKVTVSLKKLIWLRLELASFLTVPNSCGA